MYLWFGKVKDDFDCFVLLLKLLFVYGVLFDMLIVQGVEWVQIDELIFVIEFDVEWCYVFCIVYVVLEMCCIKLLFVMYFGQFQDNLMFVVLLLVDGLYIDVINVCDEVDVLVCELLFECVLLIGVINGCNIWKMDLNVMFDWFELFVK